MQLWILMIACRRAIPVPVSPPEEDPSAQWAAVLKRVVSSNGVDYVGLAKERDILDQYVAWVADNGPQQNRRKNKRWPRKYRSNREISHFVNAYNAWVLYSVLEHSPISSVQDVDSGIWTRPNVGFFFGQRFKVDGEHISLHHLEQERLLADYTEPLIHVMLNCASKGCPPLQFWEYKTMNRDARRALKTFIASEHGARKINGEWQLSELFQWYEKDFIDWSDAQNLCEYLTPFAAGELRVFLNEPRCELQFFAYDWQLNSLNASANSPLDSKSVKD